MTPPPPPQQPPPPAVPLPHPPAPGGDLGPAAADSGERAHDAGTAATGVESAGVAGHRPLTVAESDAAADAAAVGNLLRCWIRETGHPAPDDASLTVALPTSGTTVRVPVAYWSPTGWHRFGPARLATGTAVPAPALAALLALEAAPDDTSGVTDLVGRVTDSVARTAVFLHDRSAAPDEPAGTTAFLAAERALVLGHPLHPAPKSREGLAEYEAARYAPEARGTFPLHWFAADPSVVVGDSTLPRSAAAITAELAQDTVRPPEGTVLVPVHPWQARALVTRPAIQELLRVGLLHDLGPGGPEWTPTSSVRTVHRADAPVMLKLSLGLRITNSRRENLGLELRRGLEVDRLLTAGLASVLADAHPGFAVVRDPAWLAVTTPDGDLTGLDLVIRDNPFRAADAPQARCLAGLTAEGPRSDGHPSPLASLVHGLAARSHRTVADVAAEWFTRYLDTVLTPVLWLHAEYGLGLEAHQQNTLVVLDEDGWPVGGRYRDNQGYYFSPTRSEALYPWSPGVGQDLGTYVADDVIDERLTYYLGVNNLLGLVGALGSQGLASEPVLLRHAATVLRRLAEEHGDRLRLAHRLVADPTLPCKANLLTRVHGMDELVGSLENQSVYVRIDNPIAAAAR